ncbi:MAG: hypothetical protein ACREFT_18730, partial [Acetobacteraceae bacterium]
MENTRVAGTRRIFATPALCTLLLSPPLALLHAAPASAQAAGTAAAGTAQSTPEVSLAPAPTPSGGSSQGELAEVVVTALKRSTSIQQTPLAI